MSPHRRYPVILLAAVGAYWCSICTAQLPTAAGPLLTAANEPAEHSEPTVADQREQVAERLRVAQRSLPQADTKNAEAPEPTSREVELLSQNDLVLQQQQAAEQRRSELERDREDAQAQLDSLRQNGPEAEPPYSFLRLESLNDALIAQESRLESREAAYQASREALQNAKEMAEDAAKDRRRAAELAKSNQESARAGELAQEVERAKLMSDLADSTVALRQIELENARYLLATTKLRIDVLEETIEVVSEDVRFSADDLKQQFVELDRLKKSINGELENNALGQQYLDEQWSNARRKLEESSDATPAMKAEVEAREVTRSLRAEQTRMLNDQLQWLGPMRQTWHRRHKVATNDFSTAELEEWLENAEAVNDELSYERRLIDARLNGLRSNMAAADRRIQDIGDEDAQLRRWLRDKQRSLRAGIEFYNDSYIRLDAAMRLHEKLIREIEQKTSRFSLSQWAEVYWQRLAGLWSYELTSAEGDNPITVGKVVMGALLLFLGFVISKRVSRFLGRRILPRFGVQEGAAHALGSLTFYALATCAALMALRLVNVPLTLFTFFGGAIAIGVGFGSQRPINNFLSGLILLTERPVRVGDMIQLGEVTGIIEAIGTRSTRVRTETNLEVVVPNSALLENNVSNWTLSDPTIRTEVKVGVVYGSPTDQVTEIMQAVAEQHIRVLDAPEAFVWFTGFGDNSLDFELHFYLVFRNLTEQKRIQSELRLEIERRFRDAGIVVAFPQRDVHLDTVKPLEIRVARPPLDQRRRSA